MNEPNPAVVKAIWERVMAWAVESGRIAIDADADELAAEELNNGTTR